jgi:hypothetical protein
MIAHGEEEMLAGYLATGIMTNGNYDFEPPRKKKAEKFGRLTVQGEWSAYLRSDAYFGKMMAEQKSQTWDRLINLFTENVLAGTSVSVLGAESTVTMSERGLRFMAMESRFSRWMLGEAVEGALRMAMKLKQDRYARVIFPTQASADPKLAYVIMVLAFPTDLEAKGGWKGGYEQYRETRAKMLEAYCLVVLSQNRNLNTAVGVALDAHSSQTGRRGGSEDLYAIRIDDWTPELEAEAAQLRDAYDVLREERLNKQLVPYDEFPVIDAETDDRLRWRRRKLKKRDKRR